MQGERAQQVKREAHAALIEEVVLVFGDCRLRQIEIGERRIGFFKLYLGRCSRTQEVRTAERLFGP